MRRDVEFTSKGTVCRGWFYPPVGANGPAAAVVMAHGFSAVKEQCLDRFATRFAAAGFAVLAFDFRFLGASDGEPRQQVLPQEQREDYRNAITWMAQQPEVDAERIGVWGTSYSGGHVLALGAFDRRVKAVVAQVPNVGVWRPALEAGALDGVRFLHELVTADRVARYPGEEVHTIDVVAPPGQPCVLATPDAWEWFASDDAQVPGWENRVTIESVERLVEDDPTGAIALIAPAPLLVVAAEHDSLIPVDAVRAAFARAGEPKELVVLGCGHFDVYEREPWHTQVVEREIEWFARALSPPA